MLWRWIIQYRGKRNIPAKVIFEQMEKSLRSLNENLLDAAGAIPDDMPEIDRLQVREALMKARKLEGDIKSLTKSNRNIQC